METQTRRRFLAALPAIAGGLAGCAGSQRGTSESSSRSASGRRGRTIPDQSATDPPVLFRRAASDRPPIRITDGDDTGEDEEDDSRLREHTRHLGTKLIDNAATADRLVADSPADSGGSQSEDSTDLSTFLSETDFESETLYLETKGIDECFRLTLCYVAWESDSVETDYGRLLRPYDEQCVADRRVSESRLIRLPVALDANEVNGFGSSTSSSRCGRGRRQIAANDSGGPDMSVPAANSSSASPNGSGSE